MQQRSQNKGEEFLIPEYTLFDAGLFVFTQKSFDKLHVSGGVRYDLRFLNSLPLYLSANDEPTVVSDTTTTLKFADFNTTFSNYSASLGGSYRLTSKLTAKLYLSRGFRSPNMAELGSNGIHEGTFRYELGNTQLNPETSLQIDAGLLYNSNHISFEIAVFNNYIQNYIFLQKLSSASGGDSIVELSDPRPAFKFVQGNANLYGGEFAIDIHPHPLDWLHFENSFSFVRGEQLNQPDSTKYLPFIPAPKIQSELRANFKKAGTHIRALYIKVDAAYTFLQSEVLSAFGKETPTQSYSLLNAGIGAAIVRTNGNTLFSLSFTVNQPLGCGLLKSFKQIKVCPSQFGKWQDGCI